MTGSLTVFGHFSLWLTAESWMLKRASCWILVVGRRAGARVELVHELSIGFLKVCKANQSVDSSSQPVSAKVGPLAAGVFAACS